jgi:threonine dehydrogenase-like Zn-dependent dehydrogenase
MKKAVILGRQKAGLVEVPDPEPIEDWVVVKIHAAPMCTEYKRFESGESTCSCHASCWLWPVFPVCRR